jgi:hypothetical protein
MKKEKIFPHMNYRIAKDQGFPQRSRAVALPKDIETTVEPASSTTADKTQILATETLRAAL